MTTNNDDQCESANSANSANRCGEEPEEGYRVKLHFFNHPYKELFWGYGFSEADIPKDLLDRLYSNLKEIHAANKEAGLRAGVDWLIANADADTRKVLLRKMFDSIVNTPNITTVANEG